jgi:hypothetical protein
MNSCGKEPLTVRSAACQRSRRCLSMRRMASSSGMQVSVTRLRCASSSLTSSFRREVAVIGHALVVGRARRGCRCPPRGWRRCSKCHGPCPGGSSRRARGRARRCSSRRPASRSCCRPWSRCADVPVGGIDQRGGVEVAVMGRMKRRQGRQTSSGVPFARAGSSNQGRSRGRQRQVQCCVRQRPDDQLVGANRHDAPAGEQRRENAAASSAPAGRRPATARPRCRCRNSRSWRAGACRRARPARASAADDPERAAIRERISRSRARFSASGSWFGSTGSMTVTTVSSATKRVMSSTWPVGVGDAVAEPQHLVDTEQPAQARLDLGARQRRVAVLVQQALLGRQHSAGAVDVDRAALEDQPAVELRQAQRRGHLSRDRVVEVPRRVLAAPGVESAVHGGEAAVRRRGSRRSRRGRGTRRRWSGNDEIRRLGLMRPRRGGRARGPRAPGPAR